MKKYIDVFNKKHERYLVSCELKLSTTTNCVIYVRINTKLNLDYFFNFPKTSILSKIIQVSYYFSHIYEMRVTFSSSFRDMA